MPEQTPDQILIVDDDPVTLDLLGTHLRRAGYEPLTAGNGVKALSILHEQQPRVVISDWLMPKLDGLQILREVRQIQDVGLIYFIMLTVQADKDRLMEALDAGADDFLSKPFHEGELLARVRAGIRLVRMYDQMGQRQAALAQSNGELSRLNDKLRVAASTDDLTRLLNRRQALIRLQELFTAYRRSGQTFSCAMIDVDHFKQVNDRFGHHKGDEVLQHIGGTILQCVRSGDSVYRIGGEEFLILFPGQGIADAFACAERCRLTVPSQVRAGAADSPGITLSVGVAEIAAAMESPDEFLRQADRAMYRAKEGGRNTTVAA